MIVTKYQLAKYFNRQPKGGYKGVRICGSFDSYISALFFKLLTFRVGYRIEKFEVDTDLFKED